MNDTKEKKSKLQIVISILTLTVILFAEIYFMINFKESYVAIILLAIIAVAAVYIMINAYMTLDEIKEAKRNEHLENLYKSDKASYMMLKKSFAEIEEKLITLQEISKLPGEEIINAQKGTAKVIINRSKENADAMINSNNQVLEKLNNIEVIAIRVNSDTSMRELTDREKLHHTELALDNYNKFDYIIDNKFDYNLKIQVKEILEGMK